MLLQDLLTAFALLLIIEGLAEGLGEVQEMIDICDFAVGLSRQLYGLTMQDLSRLDPRIIRIGGIISMLAGAVLLQF